MDFLGNHLLSLILFIPTGAALLLLLIPRDRLTLIRWFSLIASLIPLILSVILWLRFDPQGANFQFVEEAVWYPAIHSSYHVGVDGIALTMVLLTTLLTPLAILASFSIQDNVRTYMVLFLLLETGMLGVFVALDLLLFFVFWEVGLVPMYFLIAQWGGSNRNYASLKFILYTMAGSLGLLLAIQLIGVVTQTYDITRLIELWPSLDLPGGVLLGLPLSTVKAIAFWAFVVAFAIKVPVWPFHTWLPDAHTEAPTAGSMILAGVLLKLGAFGFIRLVLPLYPAESRQYALWLAGLATLAIIFGALGAFGQNDFKRLVAYSSINHMGFVVLGVAAMAIAPGTLDANIAMNGAVLQMFNHGLYSAGMFFLVGVIYERAHTRDLNAFGGLYALLPVYGSVLIFTSMASLGLPGLNGFVSEFMVVRGAWGVLTLFTVLSMIGLFFTGAYTLKALWKVLHGPLNEHWKGHVSEMNVREMLVIAPLMVLILVIGVMPGWIVDVINRAVMLWF
ncbi:NADH-quinone oxidoreductase subunit M [Anaerolinea sp.]|uniref:complex I subunit 4 family protein n=1 Tax=Anaerolinea sp. TaxID=1872519 RepID=UPI002ACDD751|nr:NADH-quinone oxidoreductase subunit M [Anaerolinea sp.]